MATLKICLIALSAGCFISFVWAISKLFVAGNGPTPATMRSLSLVGSFCFVSQLLAIIRAPQITATSFTVALLLYSASFGLFCWAVPVARRARLGLAFNHVQSKALIFTGPYAWFRHPFYLSYTAFWVAGAFASNNVWLSLTIPIMGSFYVSAIRREETELLDSEFGPEYRRYKERIGWFGKV